MFITKRLFAIVKIKKMSMKNHLKIQLDFFEEKWIIPTNEQKTKDKNDTSYVFNVRNALYKNKCDFECVLTRSSSLCDAGGKVAWRKMAYPKQYVTTMSGKIFIKKAFF